MEAPETMEPFVRSLLHTLWQAALIAGALAAILRIIPAREAQFRYLLSGFALIAIVLSGIATWSLREVSFQRAAQATEAVNAANAITPRAAHRSPEISTQPDHVFQSPGPFTPAPLEAAHRRWITITAVGWLCGAALFLCRTAFSVLGASRLRSNALEILPLPQVLQETLVALNMANRRVRLFASERVQSPAVIGLFVPAILLPASLLAGAPREVLRAVIAHELAHIRRWDYLVNLGQMIIESLLFFNPFVWWISRQIRREREACCDQIAAGLCGSQSAYLEAILACVASDNNPLPAAALAANGNERTLLDRARRLLEPGYRPAMRIRGVTFAGLLAFTALILIALLTGARFAAEILTPQQRIEKITQLHKDYGLPKESDDATLRKEARARVITIAGRITTQDGKPLVVGKKWLTIRTQYLPHDPIGSHIIAAQIDAEGRFSAELPAGTISIMAWAEGFAPLTPPPFKAETSRDDLHLTLSKGFDARLILTDQHGHPIRDARINAKSSWSTFTTDYEVITDREGTAILPSLADAPTNLSVTANGFESDQRSDFRFSKDAPLKWALKATPSLHGKIISSRSGEPISGAEIRQAGIRGPKGFMSEPSTAPLIATSDSKGEFKLDTLRADSTYTFYVTAQGHETILSPSVNLRDQHLTEWSLGAPLSIEGKVIIPPSAPDQKEIFIQCRQTIPVTDSSFTAGPSLEAPIKDGIATFRFENLLAAPTEIIVGEQSQSFPNFASSLTDVVFDDPNKAIPESEVIFEFNLPESSPPPSGDLHFQYYRYGTQRNIVVEKNIPITEGVAKLKVPLPNRITIISPRGLIGYALSDPHKSYDLPPSNAPHRIELEVIPAGALYGEITASKALTWPLSIAIQSISDGNTEHELTVASAPKSDVDPMHHFLATPLSLNKSYRLVTHSNFTYITPPAFVLTENNSIQKFPLFIPEGKSVRVLVTDELGTPLPGLLWSFKFTTAWGYGFHHSGSLYTKDDGSFVIPDINFNAKGEYRVCLDSRVKFLPVEKPLSQHSLKTTIRLKLGKRLSGRVIDAATNWPVSGAIVKAEYAEMRKPSSFSKRRAKFRSPTPGITVFHAEAPTDAQGRFQFSNLPDAPMILQLGNAGFPDGTTPPRFTPGQTEAVSVRAKLYPTGEPRAVKPE